MADPVWLMDIGHNPIRDTIVYRPIDADEVFQAEDGPGFEIMGPRTGATLYDYKGTWPIARGDYPRWLAWFKTETDFGRIPFVLHDPFANVARRWRRVPDSELGVVLAHATEIHVTLSLRSLP